MGSRLLRRNARKAIAARPWLLEFIRIRATGPVTEDTTPNLFLETVFSRHRLRCADVLEHRLRSLFFPAENGPSGHPARATQKRPPLLVLLACDARATPRKVSFAMVPAIDFGTGKRSCQRVRPPLRLMILAGLLLPFAAWAQISYTGTIANQDFGS